MNGSRGSFIFTLLCPFVRTAYIMAQGLTPAQPMNNQTRNIMQ